MSDSPTAPTLHDLYSAIGKVQVYWSFLEDELRRQLVKADYSAGRATALGAWRNFVRERASPSLTRHLDEVDTVARLRNLLAHGIQSTTANPWENSSAEIVCVDLDGRSVTLTLPAVINLAEEIDRVRLSLPSQRLNATAQRRSICPALLLLPG